MSLKGNRITPLDMPNNDYMKFVKRVIYELNLKDQNEVSKFSRF